jgi:hypothetical protein
MNEKSWANGFIIRLLDVISVKLIIKLITHIDDI